MPPDPHELADRPSAGAGDPPHTRNARASADPQEDAAEALGEASAGGMPEAPALGRLAAALARSARDAGGRAVASGQWAAGVLVDAVPRIRVRDVATLQGEHDGLSGEALAGELVRRAARWSAAVGGVTGAAVSAQQLAPPSWVVIPAELAAETLAVAAIELRLIAELHVALGHPVPGEPGDRTVALVRAWAERRGVSLDTLRTPGGLGHALGRTTRNELVRMVRRRLATRFGKNLTTLAPLFVGAAAGAEVNRRATRDLGEAVIRDLRRHRPPAS